MSTVNNNIPFVPENTTDPAAGLNQALNVIDALLQIAVLGIQNAPPGSPSEGDRYIVSPTGTAAWAGHDNQLARWQDGAWNFYDARIAVNLGDSRIYSFDGTAWTDPAGGGVTALQPGDNVSELVNDAGYITSASVITDHGALSGLGDDDHPQYYNETRGDARYLQLSNAGTAATANVTTSATDTTSGRVWRTNDLVKTTSTSDTTAGRMLKVGDGGLLGLPLRDSVDFNLPTNGLNGEFISTISSNSPTIEGRGPRLNVTLVGSGNRGFQLRCPFDSENRFIMRNKTSFSAGVWNPEVELYHTGNLGAGTPSKGDILVHNGTNYVRLPVGTNGQVLTANSATASGVEWV